MKIKFEIELDVSEENTEHEGLYIQRETMGELKRKAKEQLNYILDNNYRDRYAELHGYLQDFKIVAKRGAAQ
jgi:hypothetical protein